MTVRKKVVRGEVRHCRVCDTMHSDRKQCDPERLWSELAECRDRLEQLAQSQAEAARLRVVLERYLGRHCSDARYGTGGWNERCECDLCEAARAALSEARAGAELLEAVRLAHGALDRCAESLAFARERLGMTGHGDGQDRKADAEDLVGSWPALRDASAALSALAPWVRTPATTPTPKCGACFDTGYVTTDPKEPVPECLACDYWDKRATPTPEKDETP